MSQMEFRWNPTDKQRDLFEEWRTFTIGYLVTCKEGTNIRSIASCLEEHVGEEVPYQKMGFRSINLFLYAMNECIEVRKIGIKLFIFIRECAVPENLIHVRQLVNGQAKDKGCKTKTGIIKRPTKNQSMYCRPEELLLSGSQYRPPSSTSTYVNQRPVVVPQGSYSSGRRPPGRSPYAGSRPSKLSTSHQQRPAPAPRLQNRNNLTSSVSAPIRKSVQPTSSFSSSSTAARYVYQPPKPSLSGKENVSEAASAKSSSDSWFTPGASSRTVTTSGGPPGASAVASLPARYRHIEGLVDDNDEDFGYSDDSDDDGFDYCGAPVVKKVSNGADKFETLKVTVTTTSTVKSSQPATTSSTSSTSANRTGTSLQTTLSSVPCAPKPMVATPSVPCTPKPMATTSSFPCATKPMVATSSVPCTPKPIATTSSVPCAPKPMVTTSSNHCAPKPMTSMSKAPPLVAELTNVTPNVPKASEPITRVPYSRSIPKPVNLPPSNVPPAKRSSSVPKPLKTVCLDSENTIHRQDILKNGTVRIMMNFPKISFPAFFRGGSVRANMSLKAYLASLGQC